MSKKSPAAVRRVLDAYRQRSPQGYEALAEYATCLADELSSLRAEDAALAADDIEEMFTDPPEFARTDTQDIVWFMLGYVRGTAQTLGVGPSDLVRAITAT